jgi:hypothetical protein
MKMIANKNKILNGGFMNKIVEDILNILIIMFGSILLFVMFVVASLLICFSVGFIIYTLSILGAI